MTPLLIAALAVLRIVPLAPDDEAARLPSWLPPAVLAWRVPVADAAGRYGVPPALVAIVLACESAGDPTARGSAAEVGLMQVRHGPRDPSASIAAGAEILAAHWRHYDHDAALTIAAYQAGRAGAERHVGARIIQTMAKMYSRRAAVEPGTVCGGAR